MKKEKLTVLFCQIGTAITYLSLKWFPLPLPLSVAFTKFIIFTYKDSYINQSATFHSDRTNLNIKREKCDFSFLTPIVETATMLPFSIPSKQKLKLVKSPLVKTYYVIKAKHKCLPTITPYVSPLTASTSILPCIIINFIITY